MKIRYLKAIFAGIVVAVLISLITVTAQSLFEVESIDLEVYRDGLTHIVQKLTVDELTPQITFSLLTSSIENILILDENKLPVDYETNGNNLTVFTLGQNSVSVEYDSISLTSKEAEVWTLVIDNPYTLSVFLPKNSTVVYLNMMPTAIDSSGTGLKLSLYPGEWEISYVLPLQWEDEAGDNGKADTLFPIEYSIIAIILVVAVIISTLLAKRRRVISVEKILKMHPELKKEDKEVVEFIAEKGGQVFEAEIRERFPDMPRTSLWRLVRRLERLEIVEVKKIGLENQVQLKK